MSEYQFNTTSWRKFTDVPGERYEELKAERDELQDKLQRILTWIDAYPLTVFPEPDFGRAHELLKAGGMTLDAISASNMRHVLNGIAEIISDDYGDAGT